MKKLMMIAAMAMTLTSIATPQVNSILVRQNWPWSTDIKVEFAVSGVTNPVNIFFKAYNGSNEIEIPDSAITGDRYGLTQDGLYQYKLDATKIFDAYNLVAVSDFKVEVTAVEDATAAEVLYKVFNLVSGGCTDITRAELLNGKYGTIETDYTKFGTGFTTPVTDAVIWTGVTNDLAYVTTNLVMRKIPATKQVWYLGGSHGCSQKYVQLTEDYYIGVFPMTAEQWRLAGGGKYKSEFTDADVLPKEALAAFNTRGSFSGTSNKFKGMKTGEVLIWPTNSYVHDVSSTYPLGKMRTKFGIDFDLPTDAQWEVACRAESTTDLYSGKSASQANAWELGWVSSNSDSTLHRVGLKAPNAWGLYDLYGSVWELTPCAGANWGLTTEQVDAGVGATADNPIVDPLMKIGTDTSSADKHGGSYLYTYDWDYARSSTCVSSFEWWDTTCHAGCRVVIPANSTTWKQ